MVVGGKRRRLDDEDVRAADVFLDLDEDLHVGEAPDHGLGQRQIEPARNRLRQRRIGVAGDKLDGAVLARHRGSSPHLAGYDVQHIGFPAEPANSTSEEISGRRQRWQPIPRGFPAQNPESGQVLGGLSIGIAEGAGAKTPGIGRRHLGVACGRSLHRSGSCDGTRA